MKLIAQDVREYLEYRRIPVRAVAARLGVDHAHIRRVLIGQRHGSQALLQSIMDTAETMQGRSRPEEDRDRLINAAAHLFFVRRGAFQSAIFTGSGAPPAQGRGD